MKNILEISANTNKIDSHFDMLSCFLNSASTLYAVACDGINSNQISQLGKPTDEYWNEHFITAFFLARHALELAIKALIKTLKGNDVNGHNIKSMWKCHIQNNTNISLKKIQKAFDVLEKHGVLHDAQLYRFHVDKKKIQLNNMPNVNNEDFDTVIDLAWSVREECLRPRSQRK